MSVLQPLTKEEQAELVVFMKRLHSQGYSCDKIRMRLKEERNYDVSRQSVYYWIKDVRLPKYILGIKHNRTKSMYRKMQRLGIIE
jgi:intein-encoded DNA endonuclease-like protein